MKEIRDLSMNILFIIIAAALIAGTIWGWKRGLIEGIVRIISGILGIIVLLAIAQGIKGSMVNIVITILILVIIGIIQKLVKFIMNTFKLVRAIPIGKLVDKVAGAVFGAIEVLCIVWVMFILIGSFDLFGMKQWLLVQVEQNRFLQMIYDTNYLVIFLQWIFVQFQ